MLKVLLTVLVIAIVVYGITRLLERRGAPRPVRRQPRQPQRPVAPDDDPEFLWRIERERRRREKQNGDAPAGTPPVEPADGAAEKADEGAGEAGRPQDETPDETPGEDDSAGTS